MLDPSLVQHAVVLRTDKIGDLLVSTPAIRNLRRALPQARITLVTSPSCSDVLRGWDAIDSVEAFDADDPRPVRTDLIERLRRARPDLVCVFTPQSRLYRLARRIAAPVRAGFGYQSRPLDFIVARLTLTHPVFSRVPEAVQRAHEVPHHADELLAVLRALDIPASPCRMEVPIPDADRAWAQRLLTPPNPLDAAIVLHLSHKWLDDGWTVDHVMALIDALGSVGGNRDLAITVGPADRQLWDAVRGRIAPRGSIPAPPPPPAAGGRLFALDDLTFGRWAAIVGAAALVVSPDTAAIHLGSATGRPVVAVYAERRFEVFSRQWAPWMVPCRKLAKAPGAAGVRAITAATASLLPETAPGRLRA